jgi:hypothetical protein
MISKQVQFLGSSEQGIFCQALFGTAGAFEKTAGAPAFSDWETGDEIRKYISGITKEDRKKYCYVLVNALGAGEYFGSNINADYFPWNALCHEGEDYGYKTFLGAHAFQHHKNKDPTRAFGIPVLSVLNHSMKRVELIVRLDREKAKIEGADGIITRVDGGEFPDVSMGCRVPFDVCSICGHQSKTKDDYCVHMRPPEELRFMYGPNRIIVDGSKIYVINLTPRFFDISFVFIGADKTAKVMAKLASVGGMVCLGEICAIPRPSAEVYELSSGGIYVPPGTEKTAAACDCDCDDACGGDKLAEAFIKAAEVEKEAEDKWSCGAFVASLPKGTKRPKKKLAEIVKEIPAGVFSLRRLPDLEGSEPDLSEELLKKVEETPLPSSLGALGAMGIVMKPHEYMGSILRRMGEDSFLEGLDQSGHTMRPVREFGYSPVDMEDGVLGALGDLFSALGPYLKKLVRERSGFGEPLLMRASIHRVKIPLPTKTPVAHPLLDKISAAYNGYRRDLLMKLSQATEVVHRDPQLRGMILGDGLVNMFSKQAHVSIPVVSLDSLSYLMGAHLHDRSLLSNTAVAVCDDGLLPEELQAQGY